MINDTPLPKRKNDKYPTRKGKPQKPLWSRLATGVLRYTIQYPLSLAWQLTQWGVRSAWYITRGSAMFVWSIIQWIFAIPGKIWSWFRNGTLPAFENVYQREAYLRIKRRFRRRRRFQFHAGIFLLFNAVSFLNMTYTYSTDAQNLGSRATIAFVWLGILAFHFMRDRMAETEEHELSQVMNQYRGGTTRQAREDEKRKNMLYEETEDYVHYEDYTDEEPPIMRLAEDGEIEAIEEYPIEKRLRTRK